MIRRHLLAAALMLALPVAAQEVAPAAPPPAPEKPAPATVAIVVTTELGPITIALETERAPITANYILRHVDEARLDGAAFYRAMKLTPDGNYGLVQGGIQDGRKLLPPVAHEPTSVTGLTHNEGAVSLARGAPGTAQAQFFIILGDLSSLDAKPGGPGDNLGYAVFGRVTDGMDVVKKIQNAPVSATKGEGAMKGQMIETPVKIISVKRVIPLPVKPKPAVRPVAKKLLPKKR
ncbi:peptidylprolyl isomerase [Sandarakinorhabdus cyanobacteriorum]|uniref:peptidylprolyl isomerase n=1 Tax=Sandarakinorhabdus cyanobacteriorum TaxID=1981098 RepID=A0A255Y704_9SPHN|nr:peptidylprolyl isomerase [Sandarakinorhabdus cyanobacteriorum]OYQ24999.1 peptidylprolyl isomerase [Sandarakinorhabdus cyanobacteriorum]